MEFTQGVRFDSLGLTEEVQRALKKKNIEESTPVQAGWENKPDIDQKSVA